MVFWFFFLVQDFTVPSLCEMRDLGWVQRGLSCSSELLKSQNSRAWQDLGKPLLQPAAPGRVSWEISPGYSAFLSIPPAALGACIKNCPEIAECSCFLPQCSPLQPRSFFVMLCLSWSPVSAFLAVWGGQDLDRRQWWFLSVSDSELKTFVLGERGPWAEKHLPVLLGSRLLWGARAPRGSRLRHRGAVLRLGR